MSAKYLSYSYKGVTVSTFFLVGLIGTVLYLSTACSTNKVEYDRPMDPWAFRSVLDRKPRMLTLALHPDCYVAYDMGNSSLYKVWKGGVRLEGTVYTNKKNIQPTSWGNSYFEDSELPRIWQLYSSGNEVLDFSIAQKGYTFSNGQITLHFELSSSSGVQIRLDETPEYIPVQGKPSLFERTFTVQGLEPGMKLVLSGGWDSFQLPSNGRHQLLTELPVLPLAEMPPLKEQYDHLGILRMENSDCYTCHEEKNRMVGPSFEEIASRYKGTDGVYSVLSDKIIKGGAGEWGTTPMNAHPDLDPSDIKPMLDYILSFAPKDGQNKAPSQRVSQKYSEKEINSSPGFGAPLEGVHPSFDLISLHTHSFKPRVGALAIAPDGGLLISTWDSLGAVYHLTEKESGSPSIMKIASGLAEPLGLEVVDGDIYVLQKHELTRLRDLNDDGVMDEYFPICNTWGVTDDFHEFAFGLVYKDGYFYITLSMAMRLPTNVRQQADRGKTLKIALDGSYESLDYGLRTPNGIGLGPDNELFVTDNQGQWLPANKLIHVQKGAYNGMEWGLDPAVDPKPEMTPPAIWLPDKEIGNSPTEPIRIDHGVYRGQLLHGDVTHGGIKRDFLEKIDGVYQGVVFRFSQGFHAGVNRLVWSPDSALYVGEVGMVGGWSWEERQYGLEKLVYNGKPTFEMLAIRAKPKGFEIEFTEPLGSENFQADQLLMQQWRYVPTAAYGGPKVDLEQLVPTDLAVSDDRTRLYIEVPGLKTGRVVYFRLHPSLQSASSRSLWSGEAWYTVNAIPKQ